MSKINIGIRNGKKVLENEEKKINEVDKIENNKINTKINLFFKLGNFKEETNTTDIVNIDKFTGEYVELKLGNGGSWCRKSNIQPYKLVSMKENGKFYYTWDPTTDEINKIETEFREHCKQINYIIDKGPKIKFIKIYGKNDEIVRRPISKKIINHYKKIPCCVCGSNSDLVCDHKNDLYNNPRVLNINTQIIEDFQSLCNHCNLQKRQVSKKTLETCKRYSATNIPSMKIFGIDFINGNENFDKKDINAMIGTYWYDPIEFNKKIFEIIKKIN